MNEQMTTRNKSVEAYSPILRFFHWLTVAFVAVLVVIGLTMTYRGNTLNIWDETTNQLYSTHKLVGFTLLWIVLVRIAYRFWRGAPPPEPSLEPWQRFGALAVQYSMYVLLVLMPILGWVGVSLYPALDIFGLFSLPALTEPNQELANRVLYVHATLAFVLIALVIGHSAMALYHHFVRKDNVMWRMLTSVRRW